MTDNPTGIDAERVTAWLRDHVADIAPPLQFELIAGGRSNLTFKVTDTNGRAWVLRRPPLGHVLATAHDMGREHRIISALAPTDVPVAPAVGLCTDDEVNGAPFYVMGFVDGLVLRDRAATDQLTPEARRRTSESLVDVLGRIHAVDPDAVGLGDLGRKEGYIARQLKRWHSQWEKSAVNDLTIIDEVHEQLAATIPPQQGAAIVHGDYRLDNTMIDADGNVLAVLDWEICTLGDPLADVGLLMVYWSEPQDEFSPLQVAPTSAPGFLTRAEVLARYQENSDRDLSQIPFYTAFGYWKLACILAGVYTRYAAGAMGGDRSSFDGFADQVRLLAEAARDAHERT
jgi:aminoglycoside phosphotransferase (APT) family kinase protein